MASLENQNEGIWRNDGAEEWIEPLKSSGLQVVAIDHITVKFQHDQNFSTAFELRHVINEESERGFAYYVDPRQVITYRDTYCVGTSQKVYDAVLRDGMIVQQEFLRRSWNNLNRR
ncbi:MAG: hypothetical protein U9Q12_03250 [Patescibacteria group bacterium]|nr:hypothetical protein [Patescibacteria group bacterium]